ncbi:MAG: hypothetical protein ABI166_08470 [Mucilaginibacter sp.]
MKKWLYNPFTHIAGIQALILGTIILFVTVTGAYYSNMHFNGAIDAHFGPHEAFVIYLLEQVIAWSCPVVLFYLLAFILSSSNFRFIDIAGTIAIARTPMLLIVVLAFLSKGHIQTLNHGTVDSIIMVIGLLMLLPVIWMITLMYNAFTVSFNLKGTKAIVGFIGGLILAEVVSILLNQLLHYYINQ